MARMNFQQRIDLGNQMVQTWTEAGQENNRSVLFVKDMLVRMAAGKGLSGKQREWYDSVVSAPPPEVKNKEQVEVLRQAAQVKGMRENESQVLVDFARRLSNGWHLSEKQLEFMNSLLQKAEKLEVEGPWNPTEDEKASILQGLNLTKRYSSYYLGGRPGLSAAIRGAINWQTRGAHLDRRDADTLMKICKGERASMKKFSQKYPVGSLVTDKWGRMVLVMSEPFSRDTDGQVVINVLLDGKLSESYYRDIKETV